MIAFMAFEGEETGGQYEVPCVTRVDSNVRGNDDRPLAR
jgi:hypothetical protein